MKKINVVLAGLRFGAAFVPIYIEHPDIDTVGIFDPDVNLSMEIVRKYSQAKLYKSFDEVMADVSVDAVHLISPIPLHVEQTLQVLNSGKHCACTVPMALSLNELVQINDAVKKTAKNYCVMETAVYTTHFLKAKHMLEEGEFGDIQFLRGSHYQDMEFWPEYWMGLPPMYYGTHAIAPLVMLAGSPITRVRGLGSGNMRKELQVKYGNPYPVETMQIEFANGLKA